jgi:hypothetical protein
MIYDTVPRIARTLMAELNVSEHFTVVFNPNILVIANNPAQLRYGIRRYPIRASTEKVIYTAVKRPDDCMLFLIRGHEPLRSVTADRLTSEVFLTSFRSVFSLAHRDNYMRMARAANSRSDHRIMLLIDQKEAMLSAGTGPLQTSALPLHFAEPYFFSRSGSFAVLAKRQRMLGRTVFTALDAPPSFLDDSQRSESSRYHRTAARKRSDTSPLTCVVKRSGSSAASTTFTKKPTEADCASRITPHALCV